MGKDIVKQIHKKNAVQYNSFDLSKKKTFMACPGAIIPVHVQNLLPFQKTYINYSHFMRTLPLSVPTFGKLKVHFDSFFVPTRLLGTDYNNVLVGNQRGILSNYTAGSYDKDKNVSFPYIDFQELNQVFLGASAGASDYGYLAKKYSYALDAAGTSQLRTLPMLLNALGFGTYNSLGAYASVDSLNQFGFQGTKTATSSGYSVTPHSRYEAGDRTSFANGNGSVESHQKNVSGNTVDTLPYNDNDSDKVVTLRASILRLQAYQKIYQDFFRNKFWEKENKASYFIQSNEMPSTGNNDSVSGNPTLLNMFDRGLLELRYSNLESDNITGIIPNEQGILSSGVSAQQALQTQAITLNAQPSAMDASEIFGASLVPSSYNTATNIVRPDFETNFSVFTLRRMEAFQKFAEICNINQPDYKHQITAHFGQTVNTVASDYCKYLGGYVGDLDVSTVANTTSVDPAELSAIGTGSGNSHGITVDEDEHGILMTVMRIVPEVTYNNMNLDRQVLELNRYDFPVPEFANLGFEPVRICDVVNPFGQPDYNEMIYVSLKNRLTQLGVLTAPSSGVTTQILGYLPRYWYYKTAHDETVGNVFNREEGEKVLDYGSYVFQFPYKRFFENCFSSFYKAIKCCPDIIDHVFPVNCDVSDPTTYPFIITLNITESCREPFSIAGLPY